VLQSGRDYTLIDLCELIRTVGLVRNCQLLEGSDIVKMQPRTLIVLVAAATGFIAQMIALELGIPPWAKVLGVTSAVGLAVWVAASITERP
jgi:hypothetical protein